MKAELIPLREGEPIVIDRDITIIGRQSDMCDVTVDKSSISKVHCLIVRTDGLLFIRDLGSTNGTKVNGQRVVRGALLPGDEVAFAGERFRVQLGPSDPAESSTIHDSLTEAIPAAPLSGIDDFKRLPPKPVRQPASESDVRLLPDG